MEKVVIHKYGSYDQLQIESFQLPPLSPNQVVVEVHACGVNFADSLIRMGVYGSAKKFVGLPITPGFECAGVVKEIGSHVKSFKVGDRVVALTRFGGYTSHLQVEENQIFRIPDSWTFLEAASFPAVYLTAYYALFFLVHPRKGDRCLIHSAAGGVGTALVELSRYLECEVVAVVGSRQKVDEVKKRGVKDVVVSSEGDFWKQIESLAPKGFNAVFDANGPLTLKKSYSHLAPGGKLVVYGFHTMLSKGRGTPNYLKVIWNYFITPRFNPFWMTAENKSVMAFNLSYLFDQVSMMQEAMNHLIELLTEKKIAFPQVTTFPLHEVKRAHQALESGTTKGKLVLLPL